MRPELRNRHWLDEQFAAGRTVTEVAAGLDCSVQTVNVAARRLDVPRPTARRPARHLRLLADGEWLRAQRDKGTRPSRIAQNLGASIDDVNAALDAAGLPHHQDRQHKDPPIVDRDEVCRLIEAGSSFHEIARRLNVGPTTIRRIAAKYGLRSSHRPGHDPPSPREAGDLDRLNAAAASTPAAPQPRPACRLGRATRQWRVTGRAARGHRW